MPFKLSAHLAQESRLAKNHGPGRDGAGTEDDGTYRVGSRPTSTTFASGYNSISSGMIWGVGVSIIPA